MVRRLVSLAIGLFALNVYIRSQLSPNDPLFLFVSGNAGINIGLILLSYLLAIVSFSNRFSKWTGFFGCAALAALLVIIGGLGLFPGVFSDFWLSNNLLPMDSMLVIEAGVILGLCALTYDHPPQPAWIKELGQVKLGQKLPTLLPKLPRNVTSTSNWLDRTPLSKAH